MTHYILASNNMGWSQAVEERIPRIKELGEIQIYLEGKGREHGYFTYRAEELGKFFREQGTSRHPHEGERKGLKNHSDELARKIGQSPPGSMIVTELPHPEGTPEIIRENYRRFQVRKK